METGVIIAIIGAGIALLGLAAAYHIAIRSGQFRRGTLHVGIGMGKSSEQEAWRPWLVVLGIPPSSADFAIVTIPFSFENVGSGSLEDIWLQVTYPSVLDARVAAELFRPDYVRKVEVLQQKMFSEHDISLSRPGDIHVVFDQVAYQKTGRVLDWQLQRPYEEDKRAIASGSSMGNPTKVEVHIRSRDSRPDHFSFWLAAVNSRSMEDLEQISGTLSKAILWELEGPVGVRMFRALWSFVSRRPFASRLGLLIQPELRPTKVKSGHVLAVESIGETTYQTVDVGFVLLKSPLSKTE